MNKENIKWIAIQPLTGGMYLGTEEAIGHPAEFILSFEGLNYAHINEETLEFDQAGNEYYLQRYLEEHDRNVLRYDIQEGMFDDKLLKTLEPTIMIDGGVVDMDYSDIDLVVAVPVCSGLSMATSASQETKDARNCNMKFITEYTLKKIQPKIYVFENAPTLMGTRGKGLVEEFKKTAKDNGYSILFYKTNTLLHHNCQNRPRTFVVFFKHLSNNENEEPFVWDYENENIPVKDYFKGMEKSEFNNESLPTATHNIWLIDFIKEELGDNWRDQVEGNLMNWVIKENKLEQLKEHIINCSTDPEKDIKYIDHIIYKKSIGKNYYQDDVCLCKEKFPAVQFRSMYNMLHPEEERICTTREYLHLMGHPADFEWLTGNNKAHLPKIGQNVPVKTAKFIVEQCIKSLENWDSPRGNEFNAAFQDNIKQTKVW